ncbi:MAG TPA: STM4012 family radical SAM protein [Gemmataceae bacterium]|nr:STM4012 family radical SAM protein [Gemmataceae bacterium]
MTTLHPVFAGGPYQGYVYAYPHKTAYRPFEPRRLRDVWAGEPRSSLFLYVHVPFCTMRCGFCNLFTAPNPQRTLVQLYLDALRSQAEAVRSELPDATFSRFVIGGGTPTFLDREDLDDVFQVARDVMGADLQTVPIGIETSPDTLRGEHIACFREWGVDRVSIGVQSFIEEEAANSGRPQSRQDIDSALVRLALVPAFNIDLIYGLPGQTVGTWLYSLEEALKFSPHELYLYPLYVRPLTGLGRSRKEWDDVRLACYREGRDVLLASGYEQVSMRMFRRRRLPQVNGPEYCCQTDGMIGLGCGARSYTRALHYSLDFAVAPKGVKGILADYVARGRSEFAVAEHGFELNDDEQRRRFVLQSILNVEGLSEAQYESRFGSSPFDDLPELGELAELGLIASDDGRWGPTALGLEWSDAIGPWLFSRSVRQLMAKYEAK